MTLLPNLLREEAFRPLQHYLNDDDDKRKLFQLASRVADLYDQYLVYRPEWLNSWQQGQTIDGLGEAQQWQAPLWAGWWNIRASWGSRSGIAPISTPALFKSWKTAPSVRRGCPIASLSAAFRRCRRSTCRRCRRWASISTFICCSLIPVATTGATFRTTLFWRSCKVAAVATISSSRRSRCSATRMRLLPCLTTRANSS